MQTRSATEDEVYDIWATLITDANHIDLDDIVLETSSGVAVELSELDEQQRLELAAKIPSDLKPNRGESLLHPEHGLPMVDWRVLVPPDEMPAPPEDAGPPDEPPIDRELEQLLDESSAD